MIGRYWRYCWRALAAGGRYWALLALLGALGAWMALEKALSVIGRDWALLGVIGVIAGGSWQLGGVIGRD